MVLAALQVEVAHADLTEVTRVELIHQDSVVVLTTSVTTTSRMAPVLTDTTVTGTHVSSFLSVVVKSGRLFERTKENNKVSTELIEKAQHLLNNERCAHTSRQ